MSLFKNRVEAGKVLAQELIRLEDNHEVIVVGLPRGGVVLAAEIAKRLHLPLDVIVPRKIGAPGNDEFAIGAITEEGTLALDEGICHQLSVPQSYIDREKTKEQKEALRRLKVYRGNKLPLDLLGKIVIIVDDGIATGATMLAAIHSARIKGTKKVIVAVPVGAKDSLGKIKEVADEIVCLATPEPFYGVGMFYEQFDQTTDEEVIECLS